MARKLVAAIIAANDVATAAAMEAMAVANEVAIAEVVKEKDDCLIVEGAHEVG